MAQHTPGPWKHIGIDGGWDGVGPVSGGTPIYNLRENNPANATLIAAAPDMLAALKIDDAFQRFGYTQAAVAAIKACGIEVPLTPPYGMDLSNFQKEVRRAAIAKAEGR